MPQDRRGPGRRTARREAQRRWRPRRQGPPPRLARPREASGGARGASSRSSEESCRGPRPCPPRVPPQHLVAASAWSWWNSAAAGGKRSSRVRPRPRRYELAGPRAGLKPPRRRLGAVGVDRVGVLGSTLGPEDLLRTRPGPRARHALPGMGDHGRGYGGLGEGAGVQRQESGVRSRWGCLGPARPPSSEACQPGRLAAAWVSAAFWGAVPWAHRLSCSGSGPQRTGRSSPSVTAGPAGHSLALHGFRHPRAAAT